MQLCYQIFSISTIFLVYVKIFARFYAVVISFAESNPRKMHLEEAQGIFVKIFDKTVRLINKN